MAIPKQMLKELGHHIILQGVDNDIYLTVAEEQVEGRELVQLVVAHLMSCLYN
jgi:hypothetical protein